MRSTTSRYRFVRSAIVKGTWWWLGTLAWLSAIIGGTITGYALFAAHRPLIVGLGVGVLLLLILEALYREYRSTPEDERRTRLLQVLAEIAEQAHEIPFPDTEPRAYGGWSMWAHRQIASVDVAYAAEFNSVEDCITERQQKVQEIMRALRTPGSHLGPSDGSYKA